MTTARRSHAKVFEYPWCIYCGGSIAATTADHNPAKILFDGKLRPMGMEFPACEACNAGTKDSELVTAAISRAYPDAPARWTGELTAIFRAIQNNHPHVLRELQTSRAKTKFTAQRLGLSPDTGFMNLEGRAVSAHLVKFAAKIGYAFHYFATKRAVPVGGGVVSIAYSNVNVLDGRTPEEFVSHFGSFETLRQGAQHVGDQFQFACQATQEGDMTMGFAAFRQSLAIATFSAGDANKLLVDGAMPKTLVRPGELQIPVPRPEFPWLRVERIISPGPSWLLPEWRGRAIGVHSK
jgi:hypothetical protein